MINELRAMSKTLLAIKIDVDTDLRTLLNGVLLPGPHVGRRNESVMRLARDRGHEVGIHCYDHIRWQDGLAKMSQAQEIEEFGRARSEFERIFQEPARPPRAA